MVADGDLRRSTEENKIQEIRLKFVRKYINDHYINDQKETAGKKC